MRYHKIDSGQLLSEIYSIRYTSLLFLESSLPKRQLCHQRFLSRLLGSVGAFRRKDAVHLTVAAINFYVSIQPLAMFFNILAFLELFITTYSFQSTSHLPNCSGYCNFCFTFASRLDPLNCSYVQNKSHNSQHLVRFMSD